MKRATRVQQAAANRRLTCRSGGAALGLLLVLSGLLSACGERAEQVAAQAVLPGQAQADTVWRAPDGWPPAFGFGRPATAEEIEAWDIDVMPDGTGLPPGSGTAAQGAALYAARCASCHGATGTEGPFDRLVGREPREGFPFGRDAALVKTIGNYWPYATTLYDFIYRAMPQDAPGTLSPDEVYSLTAYLLHRNEIIPEDAVMNAQTLPAVEMPARGRFVRDNRRGGAEIR